MTLKHELPPRVFVEVKPAKQNSVHAQEHGEPQHDREERHLLKTSYALKGAGGRLHLGVWVCVGQKPEVRTFTERFTPLRDG